ncbi:hypothetical protein SAMN05444147_10575 [Pectobacterium carotovorum]|nr:hypothetical protein SAMN05444147_10575 [Pectobacterium carotovorum]
MPINKSSNSLFEDQQVKQSINRYFKRFLQESVEVRYVR